jgi:hypothetical protein
MDLGASQSRRKKNYLAVISPGYRPRAFSTEIGAISFSCEFPITLEFEPFSPVRVTKYFFLH